ncbi:MAG: hypothetical protein ACRBBN_01810 [Methyloligellaceae bacterium]
MKVNILIAATLIALLTGCNARILPPSASVGKKDAAKLSSGQEKAVKEGVQQVLASSVKLGPYRVKKHPGEAGLHVCGHASTKSSSASEYPYYMELIEQSNPPALKRGQVGTDSASLAKVKFMCRRHGNI